MSVKMNQPIKFRKAYISLGANLPFADKSPQQNIRHALKTLDCADLQFVEASSLWRSPAWPDASDPVFYNAVALFMSHLTPLRLLNRFKKIEQKFGRVPARRNAPRSLDIDLISYGQQLSATGRVKLPHPRLDERAFVLLPLFELDPLWTMPGSRQSLSDLIAGLPAEDTEATRISDTI